MLEEQGGSILCRSGFFISEPLEATIGLWGLDRVDHTSCTGWFTTNVSDDIGPSTMVSSGYTPFFANQSALQLSSVSSRCQ